MSEKMNEAMHDIAVKHGVFLSKDDPILILHTMNEKMLEENRKAQQEMLAQFKEEMEIISSEWKDNAKEKAEKILNAALASSKEAVFRLLQESTKESLQDMKKLMSALIEARSLTQKARKISLFALVASAVLFAAFCVVILLFF